MNTKEVIECLNDIELKNQMKIAEIRDKLLELDGIKEDLRELDLEIKELEGVIKPEKLIEDMKIIISKYIKRK